MFLSKNNWKPQVITNRYPRTLNHYERLIPFEVFRFEFLNNPFQYLLSFRLDLFFAWFYYKPLTIFRLIIHFYKTKPKVVNIHFPDHQLVECIILKLLFDFKLIISLHGNEVTRMGLLKKTSLKYKLYEKIFKSAICITTCSKYLFENFNSSFPEINSRKCLTLYNGINSDFISTELSNKKSDFLFTAARFIPEKGLDILISSYDSRKMGRLHIAGGNFLELKKLGIIFTDEITILGELSRSEIIENLLKAKLTVVPSRNETFGIFILEAICCGSPIIATNVGGVKELIEDIRKRLNKEEKIVFDHWVRIIKPNSKLIQSEIIHLLKTKEPIEKYLSIILRIREQFAWSKRLNIYHKIIKNAS